jgi:hypothetical protein
MTPCPGPSNSCVDSARRRIDQAAARANKKLGQAITPAEPMTPSAIRKSRAELFQARFDLGLGVGRIGGFDLRPQAIAAVDVGLQNFHLMVAHLIDHRSLQFDVHSRARIKIKTVEMKTVTLIVG